jgi:hypothetical protein
MEWQLAVLIVFVSLVLLMLTGMPIAICFMFINVLGAVLVLGYPAAWIHDTEHVGSLATFSIAPIHCSWSWATHVSFGSVEMS